MGVFHTTCSYLSTLGKRLRCSGFEEILVESGICASGSINNVISGKHYNRAMRVLKLTLEALGRLLLKKFEEVHAGLDCVSEAKDVLDMAISNPSQDVVNQAMENGNYENLFDLYESFKENVRSGDFGKTQKFWVDYMDKIWLVLQFLRAIKLNHLDLHVACLYKLCPLFFSHDHPNYARYTTIYCLILLNLDMTHPGLKDLLKRNGFNVDRSGVPTSRNAIDITMEQTINRHAKSHGGIICFSRNYAAYYRWCMTRHSRAQYLQVTMEMVDMDNTDSSSHKDIRKSEIQHSEADVRKVVDAISNFVNPSEVKNKDLLYCISSGSPAPADVEEDLFSADMSGNKARDEFIEDRLVKKTASFFYPVKKQRLKTFASVTKCVKLTGSEKKSKQMKRFWTVGSSFTQA